MQEQKLIKTLQDKSLTTVERGKALETHTLDILQEYTNTFRFTNSSGSKHGDGDIVNDEFCIDCKVHGECTNISVKASEFEKVIKQGALMSRKGIIITPLIMNNKVKLIAVLDLNDLLEKICYNTTD